MGLAVASGIMELLAKIEEEFAIPPGRITDRRLRNAAAARPPVLGIVIEEDASALHAGFGCFVGVLQIDDLSLYISFGVKFLQNGGAFVITGD